MEIDHNLNKGMYLMRRIFVVYTLVVISRL